MQLWSDVARAASSFRRRPGFVLLAVVTLGVGVGATAQVFGMANQLLLRPLPGVSDPDRAAYLRLEPEHDSDTTKAPALTGSDFAELRRSATLLEGLAAFNTSVRTVSSIGGSTIEVVTNDIHGDYFNVLGVQPSEGRLLRANETTGDPRIAVISQRLRLKLFGDRETVVGRQVDVDGESVTVVGVVGGGFKGPLRRLDVGMWLPYSAITLFDGFSADVFSSRRALFLNLLTRLRPGVHTDAAEAQLVRTLGNIAAAHPGDANHLGQVRAELLPGLRLPASAVRRTYSSLATFAGAASLVLILACANVATLLLIRNLTTRPEIATRRALGASPSRITRYHLSESFLLAGLGVVAGIGAAWVLALPFRGQSLGQTMPSFAGFVLDGRVFWFAGLIAVVTVLLFGVLPSILAGRFDLAEALRSAGRQTSQPLARIGQVLAAVQIAICIALVTGALLLTRTVHNLYSVDSGLAMERVAIMPLSRAGDSEDLRRGHRDLLAAVEGIAGVEEAALDMSGPLPRANTTTVISVGQGTSEQVRANIQPISSGWLDLLDVQILDGSVPAEHQWGQEGEGGIPVVLSAPLAQRIFGRVDVVGRGLQVDIGGMQQGTVIGVTGPLRRPDTPDQPLSVVFVPLGSFPLKSLTLVVRTRSGPGDVLRDIRNAVEGSGWRSTDLSPLRSRFAEAFAEQRTFRLLLGLLSGLAVVLASIGLYCVIGFSVAQRTKEFGIRMSLGADRSRVARLILGDAASIVVVGTVAGLIGAYILSQALQNRLYGLTPLDPMSYLAAILLLAAVCILASWVPARKAMATKPSHVLAVD